MASVLQAKKLSKRYGTKILFEELDLNINEGEKIALIAPNGTGKSSLLKILAGRDTPDINNNGESGSVLLFNTTGVSYLEQNPSFNPENTLLHEVFSGEKEICSIIENYEAALHSGDTNLIEQTSGEMDRTNAWQHETRVKQVLSSLGLDNTRQLMGELSGGQVKRAAIAKTIINGSNFIIMDEPTNHLDLEVIEYLEEYLKRSRVTILMVTHDRYFLDRVCNKIMELDNGKLYTYDGNYSYFLEKREERICNFNKETERAKNLYRTELDWMRRMPQARGTKAKYRISAFGELEEKAHQKLSGDRIKIDTATSRLGKKIINCRRVSHSWDSIKTMDNFTYNFARGEKIGLVGPNGVGKSTFLDVITGTIPPSSGEIEHGETVLFGYYRQEGLEFNPDDTVIDAVRKHAEVVAMSDGSILEAERLLTHFLFPHSMHNNKIGTLSGGEQRRLYLVTVLMQSPNFLILDEPTNDLDIVTLNILEEYLESFPGCVVAVSHDRFFLDKIAHHLFIFKGAGKIKDYPGRYTEYRNTLTESEKERKKPAGEKKKEETPGKKNEKKLSFKEKRELETIEMELDRLEKEKSSLEAALNSGELSPEALLEGSQRFSSIISQTEDLEYRWLELSEKKS
jgi:ATP-binding cassette subfamily F protein uup